MKQQQHKCSTCRPVINFISIISSCNYLRNLLTCYRACYLNLCFCSTWVDSHYQEYFDQTFAKSHWREAIWVQRLWKGVELIHYTLPSLHWCLILKYFCTDFFSSENQHENSHNGDADSRLRKSCQQRTAPFVIRSLCIMMYLPVRNYRSDYHPPFVWPTGKSNPLL